jgi:putative nucleotidyltransferase with HDIG domain
VGKVCSALATRSRARIELAPDEFQVVGLLHDIGKVLLLEAGTDQYLNCVREARASGTPGFFAEEQIYGFHHGEVGALIAEEWGLPPLVAESARFHHGPREHLDGSPTLALVALGNLLAHEVAIGDLDAAHGVFGSHERALLCLRAADVGAVVEFANDLLPQIQI